MAVPLWAAITIGQDEDLIQKIVHAWDLPPHEAEKLQRDLAANVTTEDRLPANLKTVAGVDLHYPKNEPCIVAGVVVLEWPSLTILETATSIETDTYPYVPGLFSFREVPPIAKALQKLKIQPDLIVCDGHGLAHPRRFGLACHLGVLFDLPTIGCAKSKLLGTFAEPAVGRGSQAPLTHNGETIGAVLRTQTGIKPVFVSVGHQVSLQRACDVILHLAPKYRLPETTRQADHLVRQAQIGKA